MPNDSNRVAELLEKLVVFQLYGLGTSQDRIAKLIGRRESWVGEMVRGIPRAGRTDGAQGQAKTAEGRASRR